MDRLAIFRPPSNPRWGPSSSARTIPRTLLHCQRSPRVLGGALPVLVYLDPPVMLLLALPGHLLANFCPRDMLDLNLYELFTQFSYLFEVKDHFFTHGFIGVLYLFHHQLGITAYLQLISFHGVGKINPDYDSYVLGLVIGGLKSESECVFHVNPVQGGQNQIRPPSLGIGGPIYGQPSDGQVGRQLSSFNGLCRGI